uniref:Molybdopterin synthase sulfur carrier subunit n=1 Tax=Cyanothece sp. (strain PCC 7425 / ATCC 29141) TaxID=395961 RepID=B8HPU5_CYAP4
MTLSAPSISVTVKLFAAYQEALGVPQLVLELPAGTTVNDLGDRLYRTHPELERWRSLTRYGVNLQFVAPETPLQDGDEVVLIPPVSGG